jgi:nanoRNase/pAp phosphatase (c-di-AMP/oligoRNAs hydrolase)
MSYFRKIDPAKQRLDLVSKDQKWLILISADPDAMAASMALKRILKHKGASADISSINEVARPDNLSMIRYTRLHMFRFKPSLLKNYTHFAVVDSQPSHHPEFEGIKFSIIIDHHPLVTEPESAVLQDIKPEYGATSTMLTEYLYNMNIRPGVRLATALQFGIRTDTLAFQRNTSEVDMRAYQFLGKFADSTLLQRIMYNEFHLDWLYYFAKGINKLRKTKGGGYFIFMDTVESPDILVLLADFFMRVYEVHWMAVAGLFEKQIIMSLRSDGMAQDVGRLAHLNFNKLGSAGGHKSMARAEFPVSALQDQDASDFIFKLLTAKLPAEDEAAQAEDKA